MSKKSKRALPATPELNAINYISNPKAERQLREASNLLHSWNMKASKSGRISQIDEDFLRNIRLKIVAARVLLFGSKKVRGSRLPPESLS
jgi:hypothetical protein